MQETYQPQEKKVNIKWNKKAYNIIKFKLIIRKELYQNYTRIYQEITQIKMKKDNAKKQKPSPKTTKIECLSTGTKGNKLRSDAKYALPLYGKRESDYRKKNGYTKNISEFLKNGLEKFYNDGFRQLHKNPFKEQIKAFINAKSSEEMNHPWKHEFENFILYYFPQLAPRCYELYCNEKGKKAWYPYESANESLNGKKIGYKNYVANESGLESYNGLKSNPTPMIAEPSNRKTSNAEAETKNKTSNGPDNRTDNLKLLIIAGVILFGGGLWLGYNWKSQR